MQVRVLAETLGLPYTGNGDWELQGAASLADARPTDLSFLAGRKAAAEASKTQAGCVILSHGLLEPPPGLAQIYSADPRSAFAQALALLYPAPPVAPGIHPTAVVAPDAQLEEDCAIGPHVVIATGCRIGKGSRIGAGCVLGEGVTLGPHALLHPRVTLYHGTTIGARVILHSGCVIGADGFGFAMVQGRYVKFPQVGRVALGDDVEIGANACVDRAALGVTRIGNGVKLDNMVHIAHNCVLGDHVVIAAQTGLSGGVVVEPYAVIGGQVGIGDKARIESKAVLGSGCGVLTSKIVRGGEVVWGTPARPLKEYLRQLAEMGRLPQLRQELTSQQQEFAALREELAVLRQELASLRGEGNSPKQ